MADPVPNPNPAPTPAAETLSVQQIRDLFMNNTKHEHGKLSDAEKKLVERAIKRIKDAGENTRSARTALEEMQRWIPAGHEMDLKAAEALMTANNTKTGWF